MKKAKVILILTLTWVIILTASFGSVIYAEETNTLVENNQMIDHQSDIDFNEEEEPQKGNRGKQVVNEKNPVREIQRQEKKRLEMEKDIIEGEKDRLEEEKNELETLLKQAKEEGYYELAEQIKQEISLKKEEIKNKKQEMKISITEMRNAIKKSYTDEEIEDLDKIASKLKEKHKDIRVMPVDSIVARGRNIKFDVPPVIKGGRTLIPVRALSEGFGAEVIWNSEEREVIIRKGEKEIILKIDSNIAYINGEEIEIDASPQILNNRTIVPLRFIIENLGLKIKWDSETETIEIGEDNDEDTNTEDNDEDTNTEDNDEDTNTEDNDEDTNAEDNDEDTNAEDNDEDTNAEDNDEDTNASED
ncbi:UNVERIFIED_CONTAM: copper amine oxidase-like protein [Acetivibrio alkalicellulosi]